ncbi:MAG TPA: rhomboid family intramembrane serine protease [Saprospiraceae bacterium]|nr:rhomboid family intramembrane serine protease [Saprospiraceae bacterium]MCB9328754.1 rhomboid family intramembrane serine protease [Lewinellaceae bacterium]HPK09235.1 rhomboid family intramembrane serine protease [Saprospiraceae bacterium]HRX27890.1 rhomboid family intramembrane serine protease [Saprospiraceae bacterium]
MKIKYNAPVTLSFSLICTVIFILNKYFLPGLMNLFILDPNQPLNALGIFKLFSHVFGHISVEHLIGNLTFILLLGPIAEEKYGSKNLFLMIMFTALVTGILNYFIFSSGLMGASGIVFMLILLVSFTNVKSGEIPLSFILVALLFLGKEVLNALGEDQVSQFSHIIGGLCGAIFGFVLNKNKRGTAIN